MNTLSMEQVADAAQTLVDLLPKAVVKYSFLQSDVNLIKLCSFINGRQGLKIKCADFKALGWIDCQAFKYIPEQHIFVLDITTISRIYSRAIGLESYIDASPEVLLVEVVGLYVFHEVYHIVQGIGDFNNVQLLKKVAGKSALSEFDTLADFVSARAYSAVSTFLFKPSASGFQDKFYYQTIWGVLQKSYDLGLRAFKFKPNDKHKIERALSLLLARRRIFLGLQNSTFNPEHVLGVFVKCNTEDGLLLCFTLEAVPSRSLLYMARISKELARELNAAVTFGNVSYIEECLDAFGEFKDCRIEQQTDMRP